MSQKPDEAPAPTVQVGDRVQVLSGKFGGCRGTVGGCTYPAIPPRLWPRYVVYLDGHHLHPVFDACDLQQVAPTEPTEPTEE